MDENYEHYFNPVVFLLGAIFIFYLATHIPASASLIEKAGQMVSTELATLSPPHFNKTSNNSATDTKAASAPAPAAVQKTTSAAVVARSGASDLSVHVSATGSNFVQFRIFNAGDATVPAGWTFNANLPSSSYVSPPQPALAPQHGFLYTLRWTAPTETYLYPYSGTYPIYGQPCVIDPATKLYYGTPYPLRESNTDCISASPYDARAYTPAANSIAITANQGGGVVR